MGGGLVRLTRECMTQAGQNRQHRCGEPRAEHFRPATLAGVTGVTSRAPPFRER